MKSQPAHTPPAGPPKASMSTRTSDNGVSRHRPISLAMRQQTGASTRFVPQFGLGEGGLHVLFALLLMRVAALLLAAATVVAMSRA